MMLNKPESYYATFEDLPESYASNRKLVETKYKLYFETFKYNDYTKELILDIATKTYERGLRWNATAKYQ